MRQVAVALLLSACTGNFSVNLEDSSSSSSEDTTEMPNPSSSSESSEAESTTSENSSETSSMNPDTTSPDEWTSSSSSSSSGCSEIETCIPCSDLPESACGEAFDDRPVCNMNTGECVQCSADNTSACGDTTPVCLANQCVGCAFHEECPGTACDIATGACFEGTCIREVDGDGGEVYSTLASAIDDGCIVVLHERNVDVPYTESIVLDDVRVVIVAADGEDPIIQGVGGDPTIHVDVGATAYLVGLRLRGNTEAAGVSVNDGIVFVDDSQIIQNAGGGIVATGGELHARNSFVGGNGGNGFSPTTGFDLTGVNVDLSYVTVAFNEGDGADSFQCSATTGTLRNSIVLGSDPSSFDCPGIFADHTAFDDVIAGAGNEDVSPASGAWFANPVSDFHLTASGSSTFGTIAEWATRDPASDIDGTEERPMVDGTEDVAGADIRP